jgi:hypothetical protein
MARKRKRVATDENAVEVEFDPKETEEGLLSRLELHEGSWAILLKKTLYVFPADTTLIQAQKALSKAWTSFKTRLN